MTKRNSNPYNFTEDHLEEIGTPDPNDVAKARHVLKKVQRILLRQPGARAVDVGFRILQKENRFTQSLAIRLHVENKLTAKEEGRTLVNELPFKELAGVPLHEFPDREAVPDPEEQKKVFKLLHKDDHDADPDTQEKNGFILDVVEARYLPSIGSTEVSQPRLNTPSLGDDELRDLVRSRVNPLVGGVSIGNDLGQAGTLGAVVWDRTDGEPCLLGNWHVLAGSRTANRESQCFQPALFDGGDASQDFVGYLKRGLFDRSGDAALASIDSGRAYSTGEVLGLWAPVAGTVEPRLGMPVRKFGRTTGFTRGFIDGVGLTVNLDYEGVGTRFFQDQVHIAARIKGEEVSAPGDSGALWVTKYVPRGLDHKHAEVVELLSAENRRSDARHGDRSAPGSYCEIESRIYFAVALNFAGDVPGTPSGEFAIASSIPMLAERLKFAFRPIFFPPSGLVIRPSSRSSEPPFNPPGQGFAGSPIEPSSGPGNDASGPQPDPKRIPPPRRPTPPQGQRRDGRN